MKLDSMMETKIEVIIFAKNEQATIGQVIQKVLKYQNSIYVIDGHSKDQTREIAIQNGAKVILDPGRGKGSAIRYVIDKIKTDIFVFMDADGSHKPEDISYLLEPILNQRAEMVIASRMLGGSDELRGSVTNLIRYMGNIFSNYIINFLWGKSKYFITDCQNGYRAIKADIAKQLKLKENTFAIEQEMVIKCLKNNFRIIEFPSHELRRVSGKSHINLPIESLKCLFCFIKNIL